MSDPQAFYARKLYALLQENPNQAPSAEISAIANAITDIPDVQRAAAWWRAQAGEPDRLSIVQNIGSASDRASLNQRSSENNAVEVRHPISGQQQRLDQLNAPPLNASEEGADKRIENAVEALKKDDGSIDLKKLFWWCWRFYPELRDASKGALLNPAHCILPDCPIPSYNSTVSAIAGAMYPPDWQTDNDPERPYLLLFTFSPVQEFIKASRKFSDFWSGSYMLHYLSAQLCWHIAQAYGPDAVITPSLWGQEIIDALMLKEYEGHPVFAETVKREKPQKTPVELFQDFESRSLSTAGFPNTITALVPGKKKAITLGKQLKEKLAEHWKETADKVRKHIKTSVIAYLSDENCDADKICELLFQNEEEREVYKKELRQLQQHGCWEWNKLWDAQIENTWQPYFVAVPLGHPDAEFCMDSNFDDWREAQDDIAQPRSEIPTKAELATLSQLNVGTWWGSLQARLGQSVQAIKNTRRWQIPTAPGERSSLSGQFTALHPRLHYTERFKHGRGMASGSLRLFWYVMSLAYKGLFDGSERLNALELTKRMAWQYGDVRDSLGILENTAPDDSFEYQIRFPNLSSIAAARFASRHPPLIDAYWKKLRYEIAHHPALTPVQHDRFCSVTHRKFQIYGADSEIKKFLGNVAQHEYNGVMFNSKWLIEDMALDNMSLKGEETTQTQKKNTIQAVRECVATAHKAIGFGESSPADWWVLLLADGDSMGKYVSGHKLHPYKRYVIEDLVDSSRIDDGIWQEFLNETTKRMGPATHVGLNRALLDFSNRLVPHLAEHRYCGKVIYSGGDDVLVALPLADMPGFVRSLRAAWCGGADPEKEFSHQGDSGDFSSGYWHPKGSREEWKDAHPHLPYRPLFTMGEGATMSMGIVIAHKSVPLPTVLENLWGAEADRAKEMLGGQLIGEQPISEPDDVQQSQADKKGGDETGGKKQTIAHKDGLCFRVIYGSGNTSEALMKGHLLEQWWQIVEDLGRQVKDSAVDAREADLSPVLMKLAEELPKHCAVTDYPLCQYAAKAILNRRDEPALKQEHADVFSHTTNSDGSPKTVGDIITDWIGAWENWARSAKATARNSEHSQSVLGSDVNDLAALLRLTAFLISRRHLEKSWTETANSNATNLNAATAARS